MIRSAAGRAVAGVVVVGALVAGVSGCGASAGDDKHPDHRSFGLHGRTLTVDSDDSALELVAAPGKGRTVQVTRWFKGSVTLGGRPRVSWSFKDDRLVLRMHCSGIVADCSARYRIEVPGGVGVDVVDGNGDVQARGFAEPVSVHTRNGAVRVTGSTGPLELRSDNGSVRADVTSRRVLADTGNGTVDLALGAVPDLVHAQSRNGRVTVALPRAVYHVTAGSENGRVLVSVPRDERSSRHVVTAGSANGEVTVRTAN